MPEANETPHLPQLLEEIDSRKQTVIKDVAQRVADTMSQGEWTEDFRLTALADASRIGGAMAYEIFFEQLKEVVAQGDRDYSDEQRRLILGISLDFTFMLGLKEMSEGTLDAGYSDNDAIYNKHMSKAGFIAMHSFSGYLRALNEIAAACRMTPMAYDGIPLGWN